MYLNLHSFNARRKHEWLYGKCLLFTVDNGETDEQIEELTKEALQYIKEYNKDKNVIYTCAIPNITNENEIVYLNTVWSFAYETEEDMLGLHDLMEEKFSTTEGDYKMINPTMCPFMNKGELI